MRYYVYISDSKIDMLLPQVPQAFQQKIAAEIGFNIGLLKGKLATERPTLDNRVARLNVIERHLLAEGKIGEPDQQTSWIRGELLARTVNIGTAGVLFISQTPTLLLGLAGSAGHIVGATKREDASLPFSFLPTIIDVLNDWFTEEFERFPSVVTSDTPEEQARAIFSPPGVAQGFGAWEQILPSAWGSAKATEQKIQFLAKRLATQVHNASTQYEERTTLATPLYVALSE